MNLYCWNHNTVHHFTAGEVEQIVYAQTGMLFDACREDADDTYPRLRCIDPAAALDAARFLTGEGLRDVLVDGDVVSAPLTVMSVMQFADDAFANGWAHDADCARMIGDLG